MDEQWFLDKPLSLNSKTARAETCRTWPSTRSPCCFITRLTGSCSLQHDPQDSGGGQGRRETQTPRPAGGLRVEKVGDARGERIPPLM